MTQVVVTKSVAVLAVILGMLVLTQFMQLDATAGDDQNPLLLELNKAGKSEAQLTALLDRYAKEKFKQVSISDIRSALPELLRHIGSTDSHLRDGLIFSAFYYWIYKYRLIDIKTIRLLLPIMTGDDFMFKQIGNRESDSVFTRTFSVVVLPFFLERHLETPYLRDEEVMLIKRKLIRYISLERDRRGYVVGKGWAHGIAHAADPIESLARCRSMKKSDLAELLKTIKSAVCEKNIGYLYGEDNRLISGVLSIIKRGLITDPEINQWINGFSDKKLNDTCKTVNERVLLDSNIKNFLKSLYFRLNWAGLDRFSITVKSALQNRSRYYKKK